MIVRYSSEEMRFIWGEEFKYDLWWKIISRVAEATSENGIGPQDFLDFSDVRLPTVEEVEEREKTTRHDVSAFVQLVSEGLEGHLATQAFFYFGMTSSDLVDTAQSMRIQKSGELIDGRFLGVIAELERRIEETEGLRAVGRTHGRFAEAINFNSRLIRILEDLRNARGKLSEAIQAASICMVSGPTGTYSVLPRTVEVDVARWFGLTPASSLFHTSQVLPRRLIADVIYACTSIGSAIELAATQIRLLSQSDVGEVSENSRHGQIGSSSMPHKQNPVVSENLVGTSRSIRSNLAPAIESIPLWYERDISHSSVDRIALPDALSLTEYALFTFEQVLKGLTINDARIKRNLRDASPQVFSHDLLCWLIQHGFVRFHAYNKLQEFFSSEFGEEETYDPQIFVRKFAKSFGLDLEEIVEEIYDIIT